MSPNCISVSDAIWDSMHNGTELTEEQLNHARFCSSCAQTLADAQPAVRAIRCIKTCPPIPDCRQQVMARVNATSRTPATRWIAWATVPALASVALLLALYTQNPHQATHRPAAVRQQQNHVRSNTKTPANATIADASIAAPPAVESPISAEAFHSLDQEQIAFRRTLQSKLELAASLIAETSDGQSTLIIRSGAAANPTSNTSRLREWSNLPLASVYPVARPVQSTIPGFGLGKILGAAALLEPNATDVYLIFLPASVDSTSSPAGHSGSIVLLRPDVDNSGSAVYEKHAEITLTDPAPPKRDSYPHVEVSYQDVGAVIQMDWPSESHRFTVKQQLISLP